MSSKWDLSFIFYLLNSNYEQYIIIPDGCKFKKVIMRTLKSLKTAASTNKTKLIYFFSWVKMSQNRLGRSLSSSETKCNDKISCGNKRSLIPLIVTSISIAGMIGFAIAFAASYSSVSMLSALNQNSFDNDDYITRFH